MTDPGFEGVAKIKVEADANPARLEREMERGLKPAAEGAEEDLKLAGDDWGKTAGKAMGDRLEREAPTIAKKFSTALGKQVVSTKVTAEFDRSGNEVRRWVTTVEKQMEQAFSESGRPGGPLNKIGMGIADAIGAGFNVSGRSPLIALLIPLLGTIVGLVLAAVQAANAFVTLLAGLPILIGGIAAQIGVFVIAFQGLGTAIEGAFAAKNAKELKEALKGLTVPAQDFVKELLPLKDLFKDIRDTVQSTFFKPLLGDVTALSQALGPTVLYGLANVADQLSRLLDGLLDFMASQFFEDFLGHVFGDTVTFLKAFGPDLKRFFVGLIELADATRPLVTDFGERFGNFFANLGRIFHNIANDPDFQKFLLDMEHTFAETFRLLDAITEFIVVFAAELNRAGGVQILGAITDAFEKLSFFLASPFGQRAMEGLIHAAIIAIQWFTGLVIIILSLFALFEAIGEYFKNGFIPQLQFLGAKVLEFFQFVGGYILGFFETVGQAVLDFVHAIGQFFTDLWNRWKAGVNGGIAAAINMGNSIKNFFANAGSWLVQAGQNLLGGLINGIIAKWNYLKQVLYNIAASIRSFWPFSPAKVGPLSGSGDPLIAGQKIVGRLAEGMHMELPVLQAANETVANNITFGAGAIQQNFNGLPSNQQAAQIGGQVADGIANGLVARDARIAIRTL